MSELDESALLDADQAFLHAQLTGASGAKCTRAAIAAYLSHAAGTCSCVSFDLPEIEDPVKDSEAIQYLATLTPDSYPDIPGTQVLVRSFDGGATWEVAARPDSYSTWGIGVELKDAP